MIHPRRSAFTLIEMLVVMAVIGLLMAMALSVPGADRKRTAVEAAARELAATLRQARSLALERRTAYAVVFNITNAAGTSGRVLNNWAGGHWYQIMGPTQNTALSLSFGSWHPIPQVTYNPSLSLADILWEIEHGWYGERTYLPAHKVRFLALNDQDDGGYTNPFPTTFPRPWCGWYDAAAKTLYPWGGYDPTGTIKDNNNVASTAFYFQARGATIPDSRNPADRFSTIDGRKLLAANQARAVVNGAWMDYYFSFQPDGTVTAAGFGKLRWSSWNYRNQTYGNGSITLGGKATSSGDLGDFVASGTQNNDFASRSGYWYVTLAPDAESDTASFPTAQAAVASMMPAFRVGISPFGDVRVVPVQRGLPAGKSLATTITASQWQTTAVTNSLYQNQMLTDADGTAYGTPVINGITPDMLTRRMWWLAP